MMFLPHGVLQQQVGGGSVYDPGMMTLNGSDAYYGYNSFSTTGNVFTAVIRFNIADFSGSGTFQRVFRLLGVGGRQRVSLAAFSDDYSTSTRRKRLVFSCQQADTTIICSLWSNVDVTGSGDCTVFVEFNATTGTAVFRVNGVNADDLTNPERTAPTTGTLDVGSGKLAIGSSTYNSAANLVDGDVGYFGYRDAGGLDPDDFYDPVDGLQEIDESTWTEWGAQPLFWNKYCEMDDNKGSAGNMTANGTITGPS